MTRWFFILSYLGTLLIVLACNKPNDLGSFLEEEDKIGIFFDSVPISASMMTDSQAPTWQVNETLVPTHVAGKLNDPIFGLVEANISFQVGIEEEPNFASAQLDSVVLSMAYDTINKTYGSVVELVDLEVYALAQQLIRDSVYYTNSTISDGNELLGSSGLFQPNYKDSLQIAEPLSNGNGHDTVQYIPHFRLRLSESDDALGKLLLDLSVDDFASNEIFRQKFMGLMVKPNAAAGMMVHFDMFNPLTRLNLYYSQNDTAKVMRFPVLQNLVAVNTYRHDFAGSPAEDALENPQSLDSLLMVQSMGGPSIRIDVRDLNGIESAVINNANLTLPLGYLASADTASYPPIEQLIIEELKEDGQQEIIEDIGTLLYNRDLDALFGGALMTNDAGQVLYSFNVTRHMQKMARGEVSQTMLISNLFKGSIPSRSIVVGTKANSGARLNITYTDL
ncbi:MAG: DUF4270 family protein [Saprospiraceae bacterium]|nr:DUF4270 family protein [Saprospiraceae bacterium]